MKRQPTLPHLQFNLELADHVPAEVPVDRNEELVHALVELLLGAVPVTGAANVTQGGQDEPEADQ